MDLIGIPQAEWTAGEQRDCAGTRQGLQEAQTGRAGLHMSTWQQHCSDEFLSFLDVCGM